MYKQHFILECKKIPYSFFYYKGMECNVSSEASVGKNPSGLEIINSHKYMLLYIQALRTPIGNIPICDVIWKEADPEGEGIPGGARQSPTQRSWQGPSQAPN